jgi:SPP1 gp7 family putative phage head morphogenesis protein
MATKQNKKKLKKPLRQPPPINEEKSYQKDLRGVVAVINSAIQKYLLPKLDWLIADFNKYKKRPVTDEANTISLESTICSIKGEMVALNSVNVSYTDDASDELDKIFDDMRIYIDQNVDAKAIANKNAQAVNAYNGKKWQEQINHVFGINMFQNEPWLQDQLNIWIGTNVGLIKSLEDQALQQVKYQVQSGFTKGLTSGDIAKNIKERVDVADSRANLIGRDQVSKLNGQLTMERQQEIGVTSYIWSTSHDERVRETHAEQDGETFQWNDPPAETGNPGEDYQCRCIALPDFSSSDLNKYFI